MTIPQDPDALDPRWDWIDVSSISDRVPVYVRGHCRHTETAPVESSAGVRVAMLCQTCDEQLPAHWP